MNQNEFNTRLRAEVNDFKSDFRNDSSAFLIWFLRYMFCLDEDVAIDSVCDGSNDKGIDGIWVDDESEEIYIFQSKFSPYNNRYEGDSEIREFAGVRSWFDSEDDVSSLLASLANKELKNLIINLDIEEKVANEYKAILVYVTNKIFDRNAKEYLKANRDLETYDVKQVLQSYTYISEAEVVNSPKILNLLEISTIKYNNVSGNKTIVLALPAKEILKLDGIQDHTLFSRNVRYWAGTTRVNKEIKKTLEKEEEHSKFFLYHNGITIICSEFNLDEGLKQITLNNYSVINGCQSILSFYRNKSVLTDDILVLTKIIEVTPHSRLIQDITYYTNNQNAINLKDLKSNDRVQIGLKSRFEEVFGGDVLYRIKRGESPEGYKTVIDMDFAAQLIEAFFLRAPYNTHLKSKMFSGRYTKIFSRRITPQRIYLAYLIYKIIEDNIKELDNVQTRHYGLAKFAILRFFREILGNDKFGGEIIENPNDYVTGRNLEIFDRSIKKLFKLVALDINAYVAEYIKKEEGFFDYKNLFKNQEFVDNMNIEISKAHKKDLVRHSEDSLKEIFEHFRNS
ncbi:AIPR family protein [Candidatus Oleimmundimicrobium sp.]|uniref:AIPR family protein n=1 Tax=Candidatus Oleimmundimicrobium sp. TaxID=3060597 RepID=UPI0027188983|nr:AIPR family protein [Candidatus Oleimmundimicrobium sp.]MDO8885862.1 AIPR family protein [Candidatus Oleimmundimicrobium sp.]